MTITSQLKTAKPNIGKLNFSMDYKSLLRYFSHRNAKFA